MKRILLIFILLALSCFVIACSSVSTDSGENSSGDTGEWKLEGTVEFIAPASAGGGSDAIVRTMGKILNEEDMVEAPITIANKPGGSGGIGISYLAQQDGSSNHLITTNSTFLTAPLRTDLGFNYKDFTPIARLGVQPYVIMVSSDSGIETFDDLLELIETGDPIYGGSEIGSSDHMLAIQVNKLIGTDIDYVPHQSDGEVITALLGGHIDITANTVGNALEYIKNGDITPLAVTSTERLSLLEDVPTLQELGYDLEWALFRGMYGPPNMPEEAQQYWIEKMEELSEHPRWKEEYMDPYALESGFLSGQEFEDYFNDMVKVYEENLTELGIIE